MDTEASNAFGIAKIVSGTGTGAAAAMGVPAAVLGPVGFGLSVGFTWATIGYDLATRKSWNEITRDWIFKNYNALLGAGIEDKYLPIHNSNTMNVFQDWIMNFWERMSVARPDIIERQKLTGINFIKENGQVTKLVNDASSSGLTVATNAFINAQNFFSTLGKRIGFILTGDKSIITKKTETTNNSDTVTHSAPVKADSLQTTFEGSYDTSMQEEWQPLPITRNQVTRYKDL